MDKDYFISEAIRTLGGESIYKYDGSSDTLQITKSDHSESDIRKKASELEKEYEANAHARARRPLYPNIGDQLDDLYKQGAFSSAMTAKIKKVKDDNPKG